ncbi:ABC transporter ATP-binding protein [Porcipelethomonas sp.]|uniref:ABC transporter ATP-binding protein n=1 Tax=Porcipelethomonas sp. TaxID=2981675 RepID=UPI003EF1AB2A
MKNSSLKWLNSVTGKKKIYIVILLIVQAALGISSVFYALLLRNIIDFAVDKNRTGFIAFLILLIALVAVQIALRAVVRFLEEYSKSTFENLLKGRLFGNLLKKDYASVTAVHSGEWLNRLTSDTVVTATGLVEIIPGIAGMAVKMIGALAMILALEYKFAFILVPCGFLLILLTYAFRRTLKRLHKNIQEKDGVLRTFMQERLGSMMIVRTFSAEQQVEEEAEQKMSDHKTARMRRNHFSNICNIGFSTAMNGMYLLGLGYCGYGIMIGTISYGTLMAILQLISQIQSPFANITGYLPKFYAMTASAERLMEIEKYADSCPTVARSSGEIKDYYNCDFSLIGFSNAGFTYQPIDNDKNNMPVVLKNITISICKGDYAAFTGHSGCGKSTLLKLIMCLYPLDEGERYLLSSDNEKIPLTRRWQKLFAYVPQGNHLMSGSIREVVAFADKDKMYDEEKIHRALKIACADDFVYELENGADTILGERGQGLSEGQMQRIAIARAIFSDNPILLLDEATSSLDEDTERKLLENLRKMTDKTVLIVTHRPAALEICDRIIEFGENGIEIKK